MKETKKASDPWLRLLAIATLMVSCPTGVVGERLASAIFVFGDSLVDVGNNNFLNSIAKSNYFPYGIDFGGGATGRFSNGKNIVDMFVEMLGVGYPPAFADPDTVGNRVLGGVNYASGAAGILDESGENYGERFSLSQQVLNFEGTLDQLRSMVSPRDLSQHLAKAIAILVFGSNDYLNNYLMPSIYPTSGIYNPQQFASLLLNRYTRQLLALHSLGLRKFFLSGVGPLGCIPNLRARLRAPPGRCVDYANQMLGPFNEGLRSLVDQLNRNRSGAIFTYGNTYGAVGDILNNPANFGFNVIDRGCCGVGWNQSQVTCLPFTVPCENRSQFVFWDAFHPTQAATAILARRAFSGPPLDAYPINLQQLGLI